MTGTIGRDQKAPAKLTRTETRQPTLVYVARHREDHDASDVITDTFMIHSMPYFALIDIGSTHSYVSSMVSDKLGIRVDEIASDVTIVSSLRQSIIVNKINTRCLLGIQGEVFAVNLMELPFGEFDLTLWIDWLVKHCVSFNYATKRVTLKATNRKKIVIVGEWRDYLSNVISGK